MPPVPLQHRLSNPPALFEGRKAELRWVTKMLKRNPMVVITGLGGQGKTALALETLHKNFKARLPRIIHIRPRATGEDLLGQLWRVFSKVLAVQIQENVLRTDPDFALATLIDMADEGPWWVLLEDLHRLNDPQQEQTLYKIAQYARTSRWIVTTRVAPGPEFAQHVLRLENLEPTALEAIAKSWDPRLSPAERQRALKASAGSPWRLYQALSGDSLEDPTLLEGVTEPQRRLLQALLALESPVPAPLLLSACDDAQDADWRALERRGLVVGSRQACRLHDLTREVLQGTAADHSQHEALCQALLASPSPELKLEGLKLGRRMGHPVRALLGEPDKPVEDNEMVDLLIQAGLGLELDALLTDEGDEALFTARMLIALHTGTFQKLAARASLKASSSTSARLLWARGLAARHLFDQALKSARELLHEVQSDEVRMLEASCLAALGELKQAEVCLRRFVATDHDIEWDRLELLATVLAGTGEQRDALALADKLRPGLSHMQGAALARRTWRLVRVYYLLSRLEEAQRVVDWVIAEIGERDMALYSGRGILEYQSILALGLGRFDQIEGLQARLASYNGATRVVMRGQLRQAQVQLDTGDLGGLRAQLMDMIARAEASRYGDAAHSARDKLIQLDILKGSPWESLDAQRLSAELPLLEQQQRISHLRWRTLDGHPWDDDADELVRSVENYTQLHCFAVMTQTMALAAQGDHERASQLTLKALDDLRQTGLRAALAKCLMQACDLFWVMAQRDLHAKLAQELRALSHRMSSPRFHAAAAWQLELVGAQPIRAEVIETLRTGRDPVAARRAHALLGDDAPLHAWDRQVLDRVLSLEAAWRPVQTRVWTEQGPVWGVDFLRQGVWDQTGRWHDLRQRGGLLELIRRLIERGGAASKEELVCGVWGEPEYHPLKHDNRLRLTVRRFRTLLQPDDPIQATDDGYTLRGRVRFCGNSKNAST